MSTSVDVNQELHTIARGIAEAMPEWQYASEQPYGHCACLDGPGGVGISFIWIAGHERLRVQGLWPESIQHKGRDMRVYQFYPYDRPAITVAVNRTPGSIAKDIDRRLLPKYLPLWEKAVERRQAKIAELEKLDSMLARLVEIPDVEEDKYKNGVRFGGYSTVYGDAEVHSDGTATLTIHNLPFDVACAVLEGVLR